MDPCTIESGLFKKKVCARPGVTTCLNCERALCAEHALPETSASGNRTGKFLCEECKAALKENEKRLAKVEQKGGAAKPAAAKPAAPPPAPAAKKPAAPAAPAEKKDSGGGLEFK
jgi:hypothetical protein